MERKKNPSLNINKCGRWKVQNRAVVAENKWENKRK